MNELQITLLIVGGTAIFGMIAYNWWQDHRMRRQITDRFGISDVDPLFDNTRFEPGLEGILAAFSDEPFDNSKEEEYDKALFADFYVNFDQAQTHTPLRAFVESVRQSTNKRVLVSVCSEAVNYDTRTTWYQAQRYSGEFYTLRVSPQLANRKGPLTAIEFSNLLNKVRKFAEEHSGHLSFSEMRDVVSKSETLDQAAAILDTLLGLHCLLPDHLADSIVVDLLTESGWKNNGRYWQLSDEQGQLASMIIHKAPGKKLLSFTIDVPNSFNPLKALGEVVTLCHQLNQQFGAPLIDDNGKTLTTEAIEEIYTHLVERVNHLTDSGFTPGSKTACLLFS